MGLIDWQKYASPPVSLAPGMSALADALDQVQARRAAEAKAKVDADAKLAQQLREDERARMVAEETNRHNMATETNAERNAAMLEGQHRQEAWGRAAPLLAEGNKTLAAPFFQAAQPAPGPSGMPSGNELVADLLGSSAGIPPAPRPAPAAGPDPLSISPPPWTGDGPPPLTQPPPTPPAVTQQASPLTPPPAPQLPMLDPMNAALQGIEADKKARAAGDVADFKAAMAEDAKSSPYAQAAYDYAARAGATGQLGKEALVKVYNDRRKELEGAANAEKVAKIRAQSYASPELRNDTANRQDTSALEKAVKDTMALADSKTVLKGNRSLHAAIENIAAKGPDAVMSHKDAFIQLERFFRGGTPTDSETHLLINNMGGIPGAIQRFLEDAKTGDFSDVTKRNIAAASKRAYAESQQQTGDLMSALRDRVGPGSEFSNLGPQVNRHIRSVGKLYGLDLPNLYDETGGGGAILGSGKRPPKTEGKPAKSVADYMKLYDSMGQAP